MTVPAGCETSPVARQSRRLRRWLLRLLLVGILAGAYFSYSWYAGDYLREVVAELDRTDPGWRLEELEAARQTVPDPENSARCMQMAFELLPKDQTSLATGAADLGYLFPNCTLTESQRTVLAAQLKGTGPALAEARQLAELPFGHRPLPPDLNLLTYDPAFHEQARKLVNYLRLQAIRQAEKGEADQSLATCRAAFNASRSLGEEPLLISQLVRIVGLGIAIQSAERTLAQGEPSDSALKIWQQSLQTEVDRPTILIFLRLDRALWHYSLSGFEKGGSQAVALEKLYAGRSKRTPSGAGVVRLLAAPHVKHVHGQILQYLTGCVEAARLPAEQQEAAFNEWTVSAEVPLSFKPLLIYWVRELATFRRMDAQLRCALVATAAERFRRDKGRWPEALTDLCRGYLATLPSDPFGGPLRYRRLPDGVIVYSVGPDLVDNGGKLDRVNPRAVGTDLGFQLWDVAQRRQPAPIIFGPLPPGPGQVLPR